MKYRSRLLACGLAGGTAVAVCACGSSDPAEPSAASLVKAAQTAARSANSVHVDGSVSESGAPVGLNLGINRAGDMSGTVSEHGVKLNLVSANGKVYIKANEAFLKQAGAPPATCKLVCGKWVQLPPAQASQLTSQLTMAKLTGQTGASAGTGPAKVTKAGTGSVNGQPTWVVKGPNGAKLNVSQHGTHYPLKVQSGSGQQGVVTYSQWNSVPQPKAPPSNEIINLSGVEPGH